MVQSMWKIPQTLPTRTPVGVFKEQASALTDATRGVLIGEVTNVPNGSQVMYRIIIRVPGLNNYVYEVCRYLQDLVVFYPGTMTNVPSNEQFKVDGQDQFEVTLSHILASDQVQNAIGSMISQANSVHRS